MYLSIYMTKFYNNTWFLILILIIIETISISLLVPNDNQPLLYIIGILGYALVAFIFYKILQNKSLTGANAVWNIGSIIFVSIIGLLYFNNKLDKYQYFGILLALISLIFIEHKNLKKIV